VASAALERDIALESWAKADAGTARSTRTESETEHRMASLREQLKSFPTRSVPEAVADIQRFSKR